MTLPSQDVLRGAEAVEEACRELGVEAVSTAPNTLWDPADVLELNGGLAPTTFEMLLVRRWGTLKVWSATHVRQKELQLPKVVCY